MLRRQGVLDPMNFLAGDCEMARRIREFDWSAHPFGPPDGWPQALRSALGICLNSAFPTAIYWGPELRLLYNDAWAPIPGPRHPAALGAPAQEVWADIWHVIEPQFLHLIETGEGLFVEDQLLPMRRYGYPEETYWNYSFTPIRGADGAIAGVFNSGSETTDTVAQRRESGFLLTLSDRLRECSTREDARSVLLAAIGEHLGAGRVGFREFDRVDGDMTVSGVWNGPGVAEDDRAIGYHDLGPEIARLMAAGEILRLDTTDLPEGAALRELGWGASLAVPWIEAGYLSAILYIHKSEPHHWTDREVSTVRHALERAMAQFEKLDTLGRERVMMREIDHRARNLLAVATSIARLADGDTVEEYRAKLLDRFSALAKTHTLLSGRRWTDLTFDRLLREELAPYASADAERVALSGPEVTVDPETAQALAMALHELATNAAKYGGLGRPEGRLTVGWELSEDRLLRIDWQEHAPDPNRPALPDRAGFGSTLLRRVVEGQLGGRFRRHLTPAGFRCDLHVPLGTTAERPAPLEPDAARPAHPAVDRSVLIVEDETIVAMDLAETVTSLGYCLFGTVSDVESGLAVLDRASPAIAILDANLAGASSRPIAELLAGRGVPYIVVTGYGTEGLDGLNGGAHMTKPINHADLARALSACVGRA